MKINCKNLEAEMKRHDVSRKDIAEALNLSYSTIHTRFNGTSQWLYEECVSIQKEFFPESELHYLFLVENGLKQTYVLQHNYTTVARVCQLVGDGKGGNNLW